MALAEERGAYPWWEGSAHQANGERFRNATRTSIAPTGTIGIIAGTTASIEPLFALAYRRHALDGQVLTEVNELFTRHLELAGLDAQAIGEEVARRGGIDGVQGLPDELRRLFVTALDVPWRRHLEIQAAFQRHVDNAVSKTINMRNDATVQDVRNAYWSAWELGLKGITIYRYGSKSSQVLELGTGEEPMQVEYAPSCDPEECRV
jgi:ribonucleoside-diphosphate reductase alpha chain